MTAENLTTILKRIFAAALDQPAPSPELKAVLNCYLSRTSHPLRLRRGK